MLVRNRGYRLNEGISNPLFLKLGLDLSRSKLYRYRNKLDRSDFTKSFLLLIFQYVMFEMIIVSRMTKTSYSLCVTLTLKMMIKMFDRDHSQTINVNEFCELWKYLGQWRQTFDRYDADRSGNISQQELAQALQQMGYR